MKLPMQPGGLDNSPGPAEVATGTKMRAGHHLRTGLRTTPHPGTFIRSIQPTRDLQLGLMMSTHVHRTGTAMILTIRIIAQCHTLREGRQWPLRGQTAEMKATWMKSTWLTPLEEELIIPDM